MFLDNGSRIVNPINVRTPPPPMFGEDIEEDFYDDSEDFYNHERAMEEQRVRYGLLPKPKKTGTERTKRLKKKIVYVYESDSSDEENKKGILDPNYKSALKIPAIN